MGKKGDFALVLGSSIAALSALAGAQSVLQGGQELSDIKSMLAVTIDGPVAVAPSAERHEIVRVLGATSAVESPGAAVWQHLYTVPEGKRAILRGLEGATTTYAVAQIEMRATFPPMDALPLVPSVQPTGEVTDFTDPVHFAEGTFGGGYGVGNYVEERQRIFFRGWDGGPTAGFVPPEEVPFRVTLELIDL